MFGSSSQFLAMPTERFLWSFPFTLYTSNQCQEEMHFSWEAVVLIFWFLYPLKGLQSLLLFQGLILKIEFQHSRKILFVYFLNSTKNNICPRKQGKKMPLSALYADQISCLHNRTEIRKSVELLYCTIRFFLFTIPVHTSQRSLLHGSRLSATPRQPHLWTDCIRAMSCRISAKDERSKAFKISKSCGQDTQLFGENGITVHLYCFKAKKRTVM